MSEYWKSTPKKYCEYCKMWIADNKPSVMLHETGNKHKFNVQKKLDEIKRGADGQKRKDEALSASLAAIERAAQMAMAKDLGYNPSLMEAYGMSGKPVAASGASTSSTTTEKLVHPVGVKKASSSSSSSTVDYVTLKRKSSELSAQSEGKVGKWTRADASNSLIDLQLPSKQSMVHKDQVDIPKAPVVIKEEVKRERDEIQPKWKAASFQSVEEPQSAQETSSVISSLLSNPASDGEPHQSVERIKTEPMKARDGPLRFEPVVTVKQEVEFDETVKSKEEKLAAAAGSKSEENSGKTKTISFKKKSRDTANIRERTDL